jgi:membrane protein DedA with SNARE-associated domain/rhodanese-related sulfurtransferase
MHGITALVTNYGLLVVFINVLLDQAGLPLPAFPTLMTAAALAGRFDMRVVEIVGAGALGSIIADSGWYWSGTRYGRRVLGLLCKVSLSPDSCVRQTEAVFGKAGPSALLISKFVPGMTNITVVLTGATRTPVSQFLLLDGIGALAFVSLPTALGVIFKNAISDVLSTLAQLGELGVLMAVVALALYVLMRWWQRYLFIRQLRMDRITVDELAELIAKGEAPVLLDVRSKEVRLQEGAIPGSLSAHPSELDPVISGYSRDMEIVVYCSCPNEASAATAARHLKRAGFKKIRPLLGGVIAWADAGHPLDTSNTAPG